MVKRACRFGGVMRVRLLPDKMDPLADETVVPINSLPGRQALVLVEMHQVFSDIALESRDGAGYARLVVLLNEMLRLNDVSLETVLKAAEARVRTEGGYERGRAAVSGAPKPAPWPPARKT